ncbi:hypothetical protein NUU61_001556 [Penicillium alfredii]|uniref:AAA+ ATPase domain-containing protein n=1 Tax=Penicillium alfredii TaxID=1506179 RepID=A0A9W9G4C0_9EURO|nr:uncharacterized protein NUU61_001556 [Penicillium alfredii]KAJ5111926.1 hypothetical protein NUU61_001556 [Penicillium alfredii]
MANTSATIPEILPAALESLFPGFSLFARIVSFYLPIDISSFSVYLFILAVLPLLFGFVLPRFLDSLQQVLLCFTASIEIPYQDRLHTQFTQWMSRNDSLKRSRRSIARAKDAITFPWQYEEDDGDENEDPVQDQVNFESDRESFWLSLKRGMDIKPIRCTPSRNKLHFFRYEGYTLALCRYPHENRNNILFANAETVTIYTCFWNRKVLLTFLQEVQRASLGRKKKKITIYRGITQQKTVSWVSTTSRPPRPLSTLALDLSIKGNFLKDIETFLSPGSQVWYRSRGFPYRRSYIFYGPPGTGKSSMCFAIAGCVWLDIYCISLNSPRLDEDGLASLFQDLPERCIVLLEDVDTAGLRRVNNLNTPGHSNNSELQNSSGDDQTAGITLSALLNCLDGVGAREGRILIMTTNHIEKLDEALTRPGRVDKSYHFGFADVTCIKQLFYMFFEGTLDEDTLASSHDTSKESTDHLAKKKSILGLCDQFAGIVPSGQFTAAEINNYLMNFRDKPSEAVAKAQDWVRYKQKNSVMQQD